MLGFVRIKYWWRRFKLLCVGSKISVRGVESRNPSLRVDTKKVVRHPKTGITHVLPISKIISSVSRNESPDNDSLRFVKKSSAKRVSTNRFASKQPDSFSGVFGSPQTVNAATQPSSHRPIKVKKT